MNTFYTYWRLEIGTVLPLKDGLHTIISATRTAPYVYCYSARPANWFEKLRYYITGE